MKKLLLILSLCLSIGVAYSAVVIYHWNAVDNTVTVGGLPPTHLKLYYGSTLKTYTNSITVPLTNINTTNVYSGYDQYNCIRVDVRNHVEVKVIGLIYSQQLFSAYSVINSNGVESPFINESTCAFIVTNRSDIRISSPTRIRLVN